MTVKNDSAGIQEEFGGDVQHVQGNLFRVKRSCIRLAKAGISSSGGKLVYGNPRWFVNSSGDQEAKGIDRSKMEELKGSIRERGMDHPIRLRATKDGDESSILEMVNGERRFRAIHDLCEDNSECFDSRSGGMLPASEVYEWVECRVERMDDATALRCALKLNETGEVIGETASINVVKVLRESGYDDQEIMKATGKSLSWLRETDRIIGLDETSLEHLREDMINRTVALKLAMIKDVEERVATLERIKEAAELRHSEKMRKSKTDIEKAVMEAHVKEAQAEEAEEDGDSATAKKHKDKSAAAKKKADDMESELRKQKPKATAKDMEKATGKNKPLSSSKIKSLYLKPLKQLIEDDGSRDDGDDLDTDCLLFLEAVLNAIVEGRSDILGVLDEHCPLAASTGDYSESESDEEEHEEDSDVVEASANDEDESDEDKGDEDDEESDIEASDSEDEDEDEEYDSYVEAADEDDTYDEDDEMSDDLEREFQEEARALGQDD